MLTELKRPFEEPRLYQGGACGECVGITNSKTEIAVPASSGHGGAAKLSSLE